MRRALALLENPKYRRAELHGLGSAVEKCTRVALRVQQALGLSGCSLELYTETVVLYDDMIPHDAALPVLCVARPNSAVHVIITTR